MALCKEDKSTKAIAQAIVNLALEQGSADNISCMVIRFNPLPAEKNEVDEPDNNMKEVSI